MFFASKSRRIKAISDLNFLDSKENIRKELDDLSFSISPANSICKACLALLNKERLCELDNTITKVEHFRLEGKVDFTLN